MEINSLIQSNKSLTKSARDTYNYIRNNNLSLTNSEEIELFNYFWKLGNKERTKDKQLLISNGLIKKLIIYKHKINFALITTGDIPIYYFKTILDECKLKEKQEVELWDIFHTIYPNYCQRSADEIDKTLDISFLIKKHKKAFRKLTVLDLGCGPFGDSIEGFGEKFKGVIKAVGIDLRIETKKRLNSHLLSANMTNLPFRNETIHIAYSLSAYHYLKVKEKIEVLKEIFRVLRPGGIFIFNDSYIDLEKLKEILFKLKVSFDVIIFKHHVYRIQKK